MTTAAAQSGGPWTITAFTLDSGGQRASGGGWTLTGSAGQPGASTQPPAGGAWSLRGGFWPGTVTEPGGPLLTFSPLETARISINWTQAAVGYKLQFSTNLTSWSDYPGITITGASSMAWNLSSGPRYYFRLQKLP